MVTTDLAGQLVSQFGLPVWAIVIVLVWTLIWKGLALWISSRKSQKIWFVILLIVNTIGILDILYIFLFSKIKLPAVKDKTAKKRK